MTDECATGNAPDCSKVLAEIAVYLDGELDDSMTATFAEHLGDCPPCKDKADLEACVKDLLRSRCADQAPPELRSRIVAKLAEWAS
jgi:anti-sigma factor (TIGR02949 family)